MKKNLVLAACLGVVSAGAFAQSSVTVYGVVDAGMTVTKVRDYSIASDAMETHTRIGIDSGNLSASRIGIKGSEDLGQGTSVIFNLEAGFNVDNGAGGDAYSSALFGRRAIVGMKNDRYGELTVGRQNTIMGDALKRVDPFADAEQYTEKSFIIYDSLMSNSLAYTTSDWHGLSAKFNYAFGENNNTDKKGNFYSAGLNYDANNLNVVLAYSKSDYPLDWDNHELGNLSTSGALNNYLAIFLPPTTRKQTMLAASYDAGMVIPFAVLTTAKANSPEYETPQLSSNSTEKTAEAGMTLPLGSSRIMGSIGYSDLKFDFYKTGRSVSVNAWRYKIGYTYDFSPRTTFYTTFDYVKNSFEDEDIFRTQHNGNKELSVGIRHRF